MKRWVIGLLIVLIACIPIFIFRSSSPALLQDSDTHFMLTELRKPHDARIWFVHDWPLQNYFYRPLPTLVFEMDNRLYGDNPTGYGWTNAIICLACVFLLYWFLREFTERLDYSIGGASLYALWNAGPNAYYWLADLATVVGVGVLAAGFLPGRKFKTCLVASLTIFFAHYELQGMAQINGGMLTWLPGRTAGVMAVFCLFALACYARYERISAQRLPPPEPGPFDPPATKGTVLRSAAPKAAWLWAILACLGVVLALMSYEQAVMMPVLLLGVAVTMRWNRYRVRWAWILVFVALLCAYIVFRKHVIPPGTSRYERQQVGAGFNVVERVLDYAFPSFRDIMSLGISFSVGVGGFFLSLFVNPEPIFAILKIFGNVVAFVQMRRQMIWSVAGWVLSLLAFLPMAWLKPFTAYNHYHYFPMALRSIFAMALLVTAADLVTRAISPQAVQAPPRPSPAPGSLPHQ